MIIKDRDKFGTERGTGGRFSPEFFPFGKLEGRLAAELPKG